MRRERALGMHNDGYAKGNQWRYDRDFDLLTRLDVGEGFERRFALYERL